MKHINTSRTLLLCLAFFSAHTVYGITNIEVGNIDTHLRKTTSDYQRAVKQNPAYFDIGDIQEILEDLIELHGTTQFSKKRWKQRAKEALDAIGIDATNVLESINDGLPLGHVGDANSLIGMLNIVYNDIEEQRDDNTQQLRIVPDRVNRVARILNNGDVLIALDGGKLQKVLSRWVSTVFHIQTPIMPRTNVPKLVDALDKINNALQFNAGQAPRLRMNNVAGKRNLTENYDDFLDAGGLSSLYAATVKAAGLSIRRTATTSVGMTGSLIECQQDLNAANNQLGTLNTELGNLRSELKQGMTLTTGNLANNVEALVDAANEIYRVAKSNSATEIAEAKTTGPQMQTVFGHALDPYFEFFANCRNELANQTPRGIINHKSPIKTVETQVLRLLKDGGAGGDRDAARFLGEVRNEMMRAKAPSHRGAGSAEPLYPGITPNTSAEELFTKLKPVIDRGGAAGGDVTAELALRTQLQKLTETNKRLMDALKTTQARLQECSARLATGPRRGEGSVGGAASTRTLAALLNPMPGTFGFKGMKPSAMGKSATVAPLLADSLTAWQPVAEQLKKLQKDGASTTVRVIVPLGMPGAAVEQSMHGTQRALTGPTGGFAASPFGDTSDRTLARYTRPGHEADTMRHDTAGLLRFVTPLLTPFGQGGTVRFERQGDNIVALNPQGTPYASIPYEMVVSAADTLPAPSTGGGGSLDDDLQAAFDAAQELATHTVRPVVKVTECKTLTQLLNASPAGAAGLLHLSDLMALLAITDARQSLAAGQTTVLNLDAQAARQLTSVLLGGELTPENIEHVAGLIKKALEDKDESAEIRQSLQALGSAGQQGRLAGADANQAIVAALGEEGRELLLGTNNTLATIPQTAVDRMLATTYVFLHGIGTNTGHFGVQRTASGTYRFSSVAGVADGNPRATAHADINMTETEIDEQVEQLERLLPADQRRKTGIFSRFIQWLSAKVRGKKKGKTKVSA